MDPYKIKIGGVVADPYRIAIEYGLDPILGQALKKILRCGRKHKSAEEDAREVITTMERWLEIQRERCHEAAIESLRYVAGEWDATTGTQHPAVAHPPQPPEAVPGGITHYAGLTQEQIAERCKQIASNARRFPHPNPDYVDAEDDTVHVDLSKLSNDELIAAGFPEDGIVREAIKQAGLKTNMEKLLDERDDETNWP